MRRALLVIAPRTFRDEEYLEPRALLEAAGIDVVTASVTPGRCVGRFGAEVIAEIALADADGAAYDAVVFVGGGGASVFFDDPEAHRVARQAEQAGRLLAAICIAPSVLARAGLLEGVRATAFPSQRDDLVAHGADWTGAEVETDGLIVTANGPEAATAFGKRLVEILEQATPVPRD